MLKQVEGPKQEEQLQDIPFVPEPLSERKSKALDAIKEMQKKVLTVGLMTFLPKIQASMREGFNPVEFRERNIVPKLNQLAASDDKTQRFYNQQMAIIYPKFQQLNGPINAFINGYINLMRTPGVEDQLAEDNQNRKEMADAVAIDIVIETVDAFNAEDPTIVEEIISAAK